MRIPSPNHIPPDESAQAHETMSRRSLLHRSMLGIAGVSLEEIVVACGNEDDADDVVPADNETDQPGADSGAGADD